jgi:predicted GH43/DUF377 family glycosyl hydrolase
MNDHLHHLSVHAYYAGEREVGRRACERLLSSDLSPDRERVVRRNRTWYTQPVTDLAAARFVRIDLAIAPPHDGWSLFNPSIASDGNGYMVVVRSSNYAIVDGQYVIPMADGNCIRTENILALVTEDLVVADPRPIAGPHYSRSDFPVDGLEDCRLNSVAGRWYLSATVRNVEGFDGNCRIATAELFPNERFADHFAVRPEPIARRHEKNWMPIEGTHRFLYAAWEDGRVVTATRGLKGWKLYQHGESPRIARGFRGGSQVIHAVGSTYIALVHEVAQDDDGKRIYEHRFVAFTIADGIPSFAGVSAPFYFREHRAIEFAAGLARRGDQVVASFGVRDAEAWIAEFDLHDILAMIYVPEGEA